MRKPEILLPKSNGLCHSVEASENNYRLWFVAMQFFILFSLSSWLRNTLWPIVLHKSQICNLIFMHKILQLHDLCLMVSSLRAYSFAHSAATDNPKVFVCRPHCIYCVTYGFGVPMKSTEVYNFWKCGWNFYVWLLRWKLLSSNFLWYCLHCIMWYTVVLTFESVDEILWHDHSNENYWAVLSCGPAHYALQVCSKECYWAELSCGAYISLYKVVESNFWVFG